MTTPKSKLSSDGKPGEPSIETALTEPAPEVREPLEPPRRRSPPPLPPSARRVELGSSQDRAPTDVETPLAGSAHPFPDPALSPEQDGEERLSAGFSALFEHTSLRAWIVRIEAAQSDAVVTVHSEMGHGQLWCVAGNVIDADWQSSDREGRLTGEDAAHQILTLRSGDVSVAFVSVNRPRLIALTTRQLLGKAVRRSDRPSLSATPSELESTGVRPSGSVPSQHTPLLHRPTAGSVFPSATTESRALPAQKTPLSTYLAGAVTLAALAAVALGIRQLALGPSSELPAAGDEQVSVGTLKAAAPLPSVELEVVPPEAEIWLDSKRVGVGRVIQGAIRDGLVHQLRFVAPGYAQKSIFFRDLPAAGKITLEPAAAADSSLRKAATLARSAVPDAPPVAAVATNASAGTPGLTSAQKPVVSDSRRPERSSEARSPEARHSVAPAPRLTPSASTPTPPPPPPKPQIQVIEVRTPRVQVID
jgi:hypothetical protein